MRVYHFTRYLENFLLYDYQPNHLHIGMLNASDFIYVEKEETDTLQQERPWLQDRNAQDTTANNNLRHRNDTGQHCPPQTQNGSNDADANATSPSGHWGDLDSISQAPTHKSKAGTSILKCHRSQSGSIVNAQRDTGRSTQSNYGLLNTRAL